MKRSSWLKSHSPLRRYTPLRAKNAPKVKRVEPAVPVDVKAALVKRSEGWCEIQLTGCDGRGIDPSHRWGRGPGGSDRLSNVVWACRTCHEWCHRRRREAEDLGLMLRRGMDPLAEPVLYRGHLKYLTDDGGVHDFEVAGP